MSMGRAITLLESRDVVLEHPPGVCFYWHDILP